MGDNQCLHELSQNRLCSLPQNKNVLSDSINKAKGLSEHFIQHTEEPICLLKIPMHLNSGTTTIGPHDTCHKYQVYNNLKSKDRYTYEKNIINIPDSSFYLRNTAIISKIGLKGGSPMWGGFGRGEKKIPTPPVAIISTSKIETQIQTDSGKTSVQHSPIQKKESHINKVSILKKKVHAKNNMRTFSSATCPKVKDDCIAVTSTLPGCNQYIIKKDISKSSVRINAEPSVDSPKQRQITIMDYDDDTNTVLSTEISLSSVVPQNDDELEVTDNLSQTDIQEALSSPLESDQISHEFLLFQENMVVDIAGGAQYSDKDDEAEEDYSVVIRSPTTSDDEFIIQNKNKKYDANVVDNELDEMIEHTSDAADEELLQGFDDQNVVIIQRLEKSPEEQISTKEDFEELIDKGSRSKEKMKRDDVSTMHANEQYRQRPNIARNIYSFSHKTNANSTSVASVSSKQGTGTPISPKISLVTKQLLQSIRKDSQRKSSDQHSIILAPTANISSSSSSQKVTSIILTHNSPVKANVLNVAPKLVTTTPAITIVSASTTQIASILPPKFTVPVISASAIRQLPNVKVIDKPSTSLSLTTHDSLLPKKIFADDSVSPDSSSNCEDDKSKNFPDEKLMLNCSDTYSKTAIASIDSNLKDSIKCERNQGHKNFESTIIKEIENKTNIVNSLPKESKITTSPLPKNSPVIIHNTPELKMTAQIIQESQAHVHIPTAESVGPFVDPTDEQTKSVVISIPSPTPSQEQMLDHIAMQALGHQRRDFEAFEDVLDMIENIRAEPEMLEKIKTKPVDVNNSSEAQRSTVSLLETPKVVSSDRKPLFPQLSPLSEPTEVTNNMLNASQQLRTLLSSLQTTSITSPVNVNSNIKSLHQKTVGSLSVSSALTTPRIIHQAKSGPLIANKSNTDSTNSVIVSNIKPKCHNLSSIYDHKNSNITDNVHSKESTVQNKTFGDRPLIEDANQDSPITLRANQSVIKSQTISPGIQISVTSSNKSGTGIDQKNSLTLTAMLQNQPAATPMVKSSADTITAAALLATAVSLPKTGFTTALVQAQPNTSISTNTCSLNQSEPLSNLNKASTIPVSSFSKPTCSSTTHFLHAQLTKVSKVNPSDEKDVENFENKDIKSECEGNKLSSVSSVILNRTEDSQNVLLKKLLQNTACASTKSPPPNQCSVSNVTLSHESPNNDLKSNSPTLSSMLPTIGKFEPQQLMSQAQTLQAKPFPQRFPLRETSFVSNPNNPQNNSFTLPTEELHIDIKKTSTPVKLTTKEELLSPQTPRSSCSQDSSLQTPPLIIKKEPIALIPQNHISFQDFKKEVIDETSQHSEVSDNSRPDVPVKEEIDLMDSNIEKSIDKEELKKQKRRLYQQKRRQNQLLNKEFNQPKKRPRKNSKIDEDYDSYIDGILQQIRQLSPINVCEPLLNRNFGIVPVIGCGDMSKFNSKWFNPKSGGLIGSYGCANINGYSDFYNTEPYGNDEPIPEKPSVSTQRGFYDQEFPLIQFNSVEDKVFDKFCREDTPDTILSCSSPECMQFQPFQKYEGLTLISDEDETEIDKISMCRFSPEIAMIKPIPLRLKPSGLYLRQNIGLEEKENRVNVAINTSANSMYSKPSKISGSVRVTLTLTSSAAENIITVLKDLANILQIPTPSSYQIIDRNKYEYGKKIGMYRTKGKDGKEGASVDIQSILNGAAKFCKHCDVVILKNVIKKRLSELPFLEKDSDLLNEGEELYFCSPVCYVQFGVMHRSSSTDEKVAATVDHHSQKELQKKIIEKFGYKQETNLNQRNVPQDNVQNIWFDSCSSSNYIKNEQHWPQEPLNEHKNIKYKHWMPGSFLSSRKHKIPTDKEIMELLYRMGITVLPTKMPEDTRRCMFCQAMGDGIPDGPGRLLNFDIDKWVHLNCALWSDGVYETRSGALMNLENAIQQSLGTICTHCNKIGATIRCFKNRCSNVYHLPCAVKDKCVFYKNKTIYCVTHTAKNEKDNELTTLSVSRRVYVNRDENRQVAAIMHHSSDTNNLLRVGNLIFLNVGQILPHQLQNFHTSSYIYPVGYKIIRFYWSMRYWNKRCRYICSIHDCEGRPQFKVLVQEPLEEDMEFRDFTPRDVWLPILHKISIIRKTNNCLNMFPKFITGEDLFGLTEPAIVRVLESLPGIETLSDYKFKYGRNPLLELPLAINPSGSARTESRLKTQIHWRRPHTQRTVGSSRPLFGPVPVQPTVTIGELSCPYAKQFVHSKSSQYKKMKLEWRNNVYLARSKIQGLGLYAARDLEKHTMVIEYIGELIRTELAECREKQYEAKNRGIYMFRLDDDRVVDATLCGGLARYINHSCNPNCIAETVEIDRDIRIIIFSKRRIQRGEELAYDYKFDIEDDQHKISCMCGAPNCRKWMN